MRNTKLRIVNYVIAVCNLLLDSAVTNLARDHVGLNSNSIPHGSALLGSLLVIDQGSVSANVINSILITGAHHVVHANLSLQSIIEVGALNALQQIVDIYKAINDFTNANILNGVLQVSIQLGAVLQGDVIEQVLAQAGLNSSRQTAGLDRGVSAILAAIVTVVAGGLASGQHGNSHNTGQSQRGNLLEFHSEFFLLMVYKR